MMTALYVFIGVLAAALVIYIIDEIASFVRKIKRKIDEDKEDNVTNRDHYAPPRTPYNGYYGICGSYYGGLNDWEMTKIKNKLNNLEEKIDTLIEDTAELMIAIAKEHPEE